MAAKVFDELGFGDFGFYSLAVRYFVFGLACFFSTSIVKKFGSRISLIFTALCFSLFIASFVLASMPIEYPELKDRWYLNENFIKCVHMVCSAVSGFAASILWVAAGRYHSTCASSKNKGLFNAVFWGVMQLSSIVCYIMAALILTKFGYVPFYVKITLLSIVAGLFFFTLNKPEP